MNIEEITKEEFNVQFKKLMRQMNESFIEHGQGNRTPKPRYFNKVQEFKNLIDRCNKTDWFKMPTKGRIYDIYNQ